LIVEGQDLEEVVDQDEGLGLVLNVLNGVVDELEDDRLEVEVVDGGGLDLTSELDVVLLVGILKDELGQISFGRDVLGLNLLVHFLETNNDQLQNFLLFLIFGVLLGYLKVVFKFELIDHLLHVLGEQEGEQGSVLVLGDLESLDQDFGQEDDALTTEQESVQGFVLTCGSFRFGFVAVPLIRSTCGTVEVSTLLGKWTGNFKGLRTLILSLELTVVLLLGKHRKLSLQRNWFVDRIGLGVSVVV